jgi:quercetin dioxygenase-like cupin family protein
VIVDDRNESTAVKRSRQREGGVMSFRGMPQSKSPLKVVAALAATAGMVGAGAAIASHVTEVDPATVPTGFFVAHNYVADVPVSAIARAAKPNGADVFVQHLRFSPNQAFPWHSHPGPVFGMVVSGSVTYEDAAHNTCRDRTYTAGRGFFDPGFGHVHRAIAGPSGAEAYFFFILPPGSQTHIISAPAPEECS